MLTFYLIIDNLLAFTHLLGVTLGAYSHRLAMCMTGVLVGLLALQSIGELTVRDVMIFIPLSIVLYVYFSYGRVRLRINR